uniref:Uncharacterized protein n=1 Tax=Zea mays TaxID=4577 RepID=A0A804RPA8_MAIZE
MTQPPGSGHLGAPARHHPGTAAAGGPVAPGRLRLREAGQGGGHRVHVRARRGVAPAIHGRGRAGAEADSQRRERRRGLQRLRLLQSSEAARRRSPLERRQLELAERRPCTVSFLEEGGGSKTAAGKEKTWESGRR